MLYPELSEVQRLLEEFPLAPVFYETLSDTWTPMSIFSALRENGETCFILESVDNSEQWGRYSFIGIHPKAEIRVEKGVVSIAKEGRTETIPAENPLPVLSGLLEQYRSASVPNKPKLTGGLVGYFGYDMIRCIEKKLTQIPPDDLQMPDCHLFLYDEVIAYDHLSSKTVMILNIDRSRPAGEQYADAERHAKETAARIAAYTPAPRQETATKQCIVTTNTTKEKYAAMVEQAKEHIRGGDIFQIVLSHRFEVENPPDSFDVYRMLRATNPSPYLYYFQTPEYQIAGASPEMLVNVTKGIVTTKPIAGTIRRGKTGEEDQALEQQLRGDPKERAEHTMLVDLGRNDVGKVCKFGTVEVTRFMQTERCSQVMHLVSDVKGILREDKTALDALMAVLPAGTLSGAPKIRTMELIDELEPQKRGLYGGTVGYLAFDGNIDTCIAIRTVLFRNGKAYVQAGAGIVADSIPEKEYQETQSKALAVIRAIEEAAAL